MKYRRLDGTDLKVSEVGFGVWTVSATWWKDAPQDDAGRIKLLHKAFEMGINFFDTADQYGNGKGETILAQAFKGRRDQIVIASKFGYDFYSNPGERKGHQELPQNWSPEYVRFACEQSLQRLQTDVIDLYQAHNTRIDAILRDDLFAELERLRDEGKIRTYGVALGPALAKRQIEEGKTAIEKRKVHSVQIIYNLLEQMLGQALFPVAREHGTTTFLVRVPHASGALEGTITEETEFSEDDHRFFRINDPEKRREWIRMLRKVQKLRPLVQDSGRTLAQFAIKFILAEPTVASVLPNIYSEQQLSELAAASDLPDLTEEEITKINDLYEHDFYLEEAALV